MQLPMLILSAVTRADDSWTMTIGGADPNLSHRAD
jgi:hypothetical protein